MEKYDQKGGKKEFGNPLLIEPIIKGFASRHRVKILFLLHKHNQLSVGEVAERAKIGFKSASQHLDKMYRAKLVKKSFESSTVFYEMTQRGKNALDFIESL